MNNFRTVTVGFLLFSSLSIIGCGQSKEAAIVGHYQGTYTAPKGKENEPMVKQVQDGIAKASLDIKADKTFLMKGSGDSEGTWTLTDGKLNLIATKIGGKTVEELKTSNPAIAAEANKPNTFTVASDGKLTLDVAGGMDIGTIGFAKSSS